MHNAVQMKCSVKVTLTNQQPITQPRTEHFAIADTLPLQQKLYCGGSYFAYSIPTPQLVPEPYGVSSPVPLEELKRELVWCPCNKFIIRNVPSYSTEHWLFTQHCHNNSYVDAESAADK